MLKFLSVLLVLAIVLLVVRIVSGASVRTVSRRHIGPLLCALVGHRRDGGSVRKVGGGYRARCRRCDARLAKASREDAWVAVSPPPAIAGEGIEALETTAGGGHATTIEPGEERGA